MKREKGTKPGADFNSWKNEDEEARVQSTSDVSAGETIGKKYKVEKECDKGGMAKIYKVYDRLENEYKAIKTVPNVLGYDNDALKHLRNEIKIAKKISHPNVIRVYDLLEDRGRYFLVMEYIDGKNLFDTLKGSGSKRLEEIQVIRYMIPLSKGLREIHRKGVIHLDLKPKNIMIDNEGEIKILDFSISKMLDELMKARYQGYAGGTLPYMAPEQLSENYGKENEQTDIWSLGATMYYLLSGKYPFGNDRERIKNPEEKPSKRYLNHVSTMTGNFVLKCLQKNRTDRYKDMKAVLTQLNNIRKQLSKADGESTSGGDLETTHYDRRRKHSSKQEDNPSKNETGSKTAPLDQPVDIKKNSETEILFRLRPEPWDSLSKAEAVKLIKERNFFDTNWNKTSSFKNEFELKSISSVQVIIDASTGLIWHPGGSSGFMSLEKAKEWLKELNDSYYAGFSDWRLPTLEEAASLLQKRNNKSSLYIDAIFSAQQPCIYTSDGADDSLVWLVDFKEGNVFADFPNYGYIRPVRSLHPHNTPDILS